MNPALLWWHQQVLSDSRVSGEHQVCFAPVSSADHSEVPSQQGHGLPAGEEGRRLWSFCGPARGHSETIGAFVSLPDWNSDTSLVSLQTLKEKLSSFTFEGDDGGAAGAEEEGGSEESSLTAARSSLDDIIVLCHQSSQSLNQQQREVISSPCTRTVFHTEVQQRKKEKNHQDMFDRTDILLFIPLRCCGFHCWRP